MNREINIMTKDIETKKIPLIYFSLSTFLLSAGFLEYYFLRGNNILIYKWFYFLPKNNNIITFYHESLLLGFLRYNLPDGLLLLSVLLFLRAIWYKDRKTFLIYKICIIVISFSLEISQIFKKIPGTFDFFDMATMGSIILLESIVHKILTTRRRS
jgi:hypothetical protein